MGNGESSKKRHGRQKSVDLRAAAAGKKLKLEVRVPDAEESLRTLETAKEVRRVQKAYPKRSKSTSDVVKSPATPLGDLVDVKSADISSDDSKMVVLLGIGESGKTTLAFQLQLLYGFEESRQKMINMRRSDAVSAAPESLSALVQLLTPAQIKKLSIEAQKTVELIKTPELVQDLMSDSGPLTNTHRLEIARRIKNFWEEPVIKEVWKASCGSKALSESLPYFISRIDWTVMPDYSPTIDDALRTSVRTTGVSRSEICVYDNFLTIVDVGGQRSERKKWPMIYANASAIVFVASCGSDKRALIEDSKSTALEESLSVWSQLFKDPKILDDSIPLILIFNKVDLLVQEEPDEEKRRARMLELSSMFKEKVKKRRKISAISFVNSLKESDIEKLAQELVELM